MNIYSKPLITFIAGFYLIAYHCSLIALSQNPSRPKKTYTIYISKRDTTIKADVLSEKSDFKAGTGFTYYWYAANSIMETRGGYDGLLLHGYFNSFYGNNNLRQKGKFEKGLKQGKWITWFSNGKINEVVHWKGGKKHGRYMMYDGEGKLMVEARFKEDKLHGTMISYQDGKILSKREYKNGQEVIKPEKLPKPPKSKPVKVKDAAGNEKTGLGAKVKKWLGVKSKAPREKKTKTEKPKMQASQG